MGLGRPAREGRQFPPAAVTADATCRSAANGGTLSSPGRNGSGERRLRLISPLSLPGAEPAAAPPDRLMPTDRDRFENLALPLLDTVYRTALHLAGGIAEAEDLTQETYLLAWRQLRALEDLSAFRPWLLSIASRVAIDDARRRGWQKRSGPSEEADLRLVRGDSLDPPAEVQAQEQRQRMLSALASLPEQYRRPLMLRYLADADYDTISRQLGLSNGSLRGLLHRGLEMMRRMLT